MPTSDRQPSSDLRGRPSPSNDPTALRIMIENAARDITLFPAENPDPIMRIAASGALLYANEASDPILTAWGCADGQPIPQRWLAIVDEALQFGRSRTVEEPVGERTWSIRVVPIIGAGYVNLYGHDITDHLHAERALHRTAEEFTSSQALLRTTIDTFPGTVAVYDAEMRYVLVNAAAQRMTGLDEAALLGRRPDQVLPPQLIATSFAHLRRVYETAQPDQFERTRPAEYGGGTVITSYVPRLDAQGRVCQVLATNLDITARKRA